MAYAGNAEFKTHQETSSLATTAASWQHGPTATLLQGNDGDKENLHYLSFVYWSNCWPMFINEWGVFQNCNFEEALTF